MHFTAYHSCHTYTCSDCAHPDAIFPGLHHAAQALREVLGLHACSPETGPASRIFQFMCQQVCGWCHFVVMTSSIAINIFIITL